REGVQGFRGLAGRGDSRRLSENRVPATWYPATGVTDQRRARPQTTPSVCRCGSPAIGDSMVSLVIGQLRPRRGMGGGAGPALGMILTAAKQLGVNPRDCWMVGDKSADVEAGTRRDA